MIEQPQCNSHETWQDQLENLGKKKWTLRRWRAARQRPWPATAFYRLPKISLVLIKHCQTANKWGSQICLCHPVDGPLYIRVEERLKDGLWESSNDEEDLESGGGKEMSPSFVRSSSTLVTARFLPSFHEAGLRTLYCGQKWLRKAYQGGMSMISGSMASEGAFNLNNREAEPVAQE